MRDYYLAHAGASRARRVSGAERQSKACRKCGVVKLRAEFTVRRSGSRAGHLAAYCKECSAAAARGIYRTRAERDPNWYRNHEWPRKLRRLYGITADDYHRMLAEQGRACALCWSTTPLTGARQYRRTEREVFDVDHDHRTGKVRGLLCTRCNRLVGLANDDPDTARRLVEYLSREN